MILLLVTLSLAVMIRSENIGGFERHVSDGVVSLGFKVLYADDDYTIVNEVVSKEDKKLALKHKERLKDTIKPLPSEDVKCLMSVDRYCSKSMGAMKSVLIQAVKEDCAKCTNDQKEEAGKVIASMMAHDPVAWKTFLTRYDGQKKVERTVVLIRNNKRSGKSRAKRDNSKYIPVGEPEEIHPKKHGYIYPGTKVTITKSKFRKVSSMS